MVCGNARIRPPGLRGADRAPLQVVIQAVLQRYLTTCQSLKTRVTCAQRPDEH